MQDLYLAGWKAATVETRSDAQVSSAVASASMIAMSAPRTPFAPAWLAGNIDACRLLEPGYRDPNRRKSAAIAASDRQCAAEVVAALADNHGFDQTRAQTKHIERLDKGGSAAVVGGQQVGLFTGPLLAIYKAAGVVATARQLELETGIPAVPVFWMQTEDHDFDEIDHCSVVNGEGETECIRLEGGDRFPRLAVGNRLLGETADQACRSLRTAIANQPGHETTMALVERWYRPEQTLAKAFAGLMNELFGAEGLLVLDPCHPRLLEAASALLKRSFDEADAISGVLEQRANELESSSFKLQVPLRAKTPLCFLHPDGREGPRYRIQGDPQSGWRLCGAPSAATKDAPATLSKARVQELLAAQPPAASTSALLRPLLQDSWLPTAMTLAGPGEIAYFAQLGPVYEELGLAMPLITPRPSFVVTTPKLREQLAALGLEATDLATPEHSLLEALAQVPDATSLEQELGSALAAKLESFADQALALDPQLEGAITKTRDNISFAIGKLVGRYRKSFLNARLAAAPELTAQLKLLQATLAPGGTPQERILSFPWAASLEGPEPFCQQVLAAIDPFDGRTKELAL